MHGPNDGFDGEGRQNLAVLDSLAGQGVAPRAARWLSPAHEREWGLDLRTGLIRFGRQASLIDPGWGTGLIHSGPVDLGAAAIRVVRVTFTFFPSFGRACTVAVPLLLPW